MIPRGSTTIPDFFDSQLKYKSKAAHIANHSSLFKDFFSPNNGVTIPVLNFRI